MITKVTGYNFIILGMAFGFSGMMTNMRLKNYFGQFYKENRSMLIFATLGLSLPLILRGSMDLFRHYDPDFENVVSENIALYDSLIFTVGDLVPISFQLSSLIFGYIRRKKDKKSRLIVGRGDSDVSENHQGTQSLKDSMSTFLS